MPETELPEPPAMLEYDPDTTFPEPPAMFEYVDDTELVAPPPIDEMEPVEEIALNCPPTMKLVAPSH
jgi:hypothetical protein